MFLIITAVRTCQCFSIGSDLVSGPLIVAWLEKTGAGSETEDGEGGEDGGEKKVSWSPVSYGHTLTGPW